MPGTRFTLEVQPVIPKHLGRLRELADDLLYSWEHQIVRLFERLDPKLWGACGHNPKVFLRRISQSRLEEAASDRIFMEDYNRAVSVHDTYLQENFKSGVESYLDPKTDLVAYFCAEFGLHESFPIYSGGLGILAGDHCKAASDLGVPFVAIGMLYRQGYFTQTIDDRGNQLAHYTPNNFADLPVTPAKDKAGNDVQVQVNIHGRSVALKVWRAKAGHISLVLLDSDLPENTEHDRRITYQLYGGDTNTRIQQEIALGIGGVRALRALGLVPTVWHINEGHAAFMILERCREYVAQSMDFDAALELTAVATVFTTHTPVPAGHDIFHHDLMLSHFRPLIGDLRIDEHKFLSLGAFPSNPHGFNQTSLALRGSRQHNGVSRIHGGVASEMESYIWPEIPPEENPMRYVTNGVHVQTFLAKEWTTLFDMRLGASWRRELRNDEYWQRINEIPDHIYWSLHQSLKLELFEHLKKRTAVQHRRNGCSDAQSERLNKYLNPQDTDVLVIGFARRFATYKRATLLFSDPERLSRLLNHPRYPVILIFAGKAHPLDEPGQRFIRSVHEFSRKPEFEGKIILLEGYDIALARKLVSGVDVWLNTPEYPLEASGTSGEKAGINGVINLSVLDGWWGEGYNGRNGWAIKPHGPEFDKTFRDRQEGQDLLNILETQVIPLYYSREGASFSGDERRTTRTRHSFSEGWVKMSKASMETIIPRYNSHRMMVDYVKKFYSPASKQRAAFEKNGNAPAVEVAGWKRKVRHCWPNTRLRRVDQTVPDSITSGNTLPITLAVYLDGLDPSDVIVECLMGREDKFGKFNVHECHRFAAKEVKEGNETLFELNLEPSLAGLQVYKIRMYPYHHNLTHSFEAGFMRWL